MKLSKTFLIEKEVFNEKGLALKHDSKLLMNTYATGAFIQGRIFEDITPTVQNVQFIMLISPVDGEVKGFVTSDWSAMETIDHWVRPMYMERVADFLKSEEGQRLTGAMSVFEKVIYDFLKKELLHYRPYSGSIPGG